MVSAQIAILGASSQVVVAVVALCMMSVFCGAFAVYFFVRSMREYLGTAERPEGDPGGRQRLGACDDGEAGA